ncbi:MAG: DNA polymerase III subunit alpha, partial [Lachnospiraceae bacterium]|nr:DNA polymerase III subunit alpha [Lachnospiraceae bacterium]
MPFSHLHVHTEYSLLDGSNKITDYVNRVKELGQTHAAITDHGVMYGVIDFYRAAQKQGLTPIIGCEVYVAPGSRFDKETGGDEERYNHLVLLAENNTGYRNLVKLVSIGFTEGKYHRPRVDMEVLCKHSEGLIALSACLYGEVQRYIQKGLIAEAEQAACRYRDCFGPGNFYLELQDHGLPEQKAVNAALLAMSQKLGLPLVATNDVHYTYREDEAAHDILLCIQTGKTVDDVDRMRFTGGQFYVKSEEEMRALFPYAREAVDNTQRIADRCHVEIEFGVPKLPTYAVPEGYDAETYLRELCQKGLHNRYKQKNEAVQSRLNFEIDTIVSMGFVDYFLIVWDYVNYARDNGIMVGPGRGSAAGSLVSYCLYITNVDPIRYNLLFERFLNPERVSMPDIDVDFDQRRRDEVIDYVSQKYGRDRVVQIGTLNRMKAKGAVRDVARALGLPYAVGDSIAKMIPGELGITLERALEISSELRQLCETDAQAKYLMAMARRLEGLPRNASTHASGVVITTHPTDEFVPLAWGKEDGINTQYDMTTLEELGLLKMDILGLANLTIIQDAVKLIEKSQGKIIDIDQIAFDDAATYNDIGLARTEGVFQLESSGMKAFMQELKPQNLEDIIAGIALYRPGPMEFIPKYVQGRHAEKAITYACPQLEPILAPTYGCIVYQEQVMQIVRDLGGYTLGRSDLMRRAMSKKKA